MRLATESGGTRTVGLGRVRALFVALSLAVSSTTSVAGTPATTANDVCPSTADPCNVTRVYDVAPSAVLDFGHRALVVSGSGQFHFGSGSGKIQCGNLTASTTGAFLDLSGPSASGGSDSGSVLVLARRRCSLANPFLYCLDGGDCEFGPCGVRRCSGRTTRTCGADADCQLGTCNEFHRCSNLTTTRCVSDADCDLGTCPAQLTCTGRGDAPLECSTNADCSFGACSIGTASVVMDGATAGSSDRPATLVIRAADSVSVTKPVNLNSSSIDSDGGSFAVDARAGSVTIASRINATGGGASTGGSVELSAGTDISIQDDIDVAGGDFDGGSLDFTAGRDITVRGSLRANSGAGAGFGGDITIDAGRDFSFLGVSSLNKSTMEMNGHTDVYNAAGDGGSLDVTAGGIVRFDANTRVIGNGSSPDGSGAELTIDAGTGLSMSGSVVARAAGIAGIGGSVYLSTWRGTVTVAPTGVIDATGGSGGGGFVGVDSISGDLQLAGDVDVRAGSGGSGGVVDLRSRQAASVSGSLASAGARGALFVDACRLTLEAGASLANSGSGGENLLVARQTLRLLSGSTVSSDAGTGVNTLRFRDPSRPPVVQGSVTPAPRFEHDPTLSDCPLCGNRIVDATETCDDGNAVAGDGCSAACQNERCLAQTVAPGYPEVPLCEDGNVCTDDVCDTSRNGGTCQHPPKGCDDGIACTVDSCDAGEGGCRHSASDALCDDGNACTDDLCSLASGCSNTANSSPCDDGNRCTTSDTCAARTCKGTRIDGCLFCGDDYVNPLGGEQCDDGNAASGDCCSSTCRFEAAGLACEDGFFCTVDDACDGAAACVSGPPNTCADDEPCTADSCDEEFLSCVHAPVPRDAGECLVAPSVKLQIRDSILPKRDRLAWQWSHGEAFDAGHVGAPTTGTSYALCIYDRSAGTSSLAASIGIAPSALWKSKDAGTFQYKDTTGSSEGLLKAQLRAGEDGSTRVKIAAGGPSLVLPTPAGTTFFLQSPDVVVQLVNDLGGCWTSRFAPESTRTNEAAAFKAVAR